MLGIRYIKASPTSHLILYRNGKVEKEGAGLSFFYYAPTSSVISVPLASVDVPFAFEETTSDFQLVTLQGQLTYRVKDPKKLAGVLDFSLAASGRYASDDPQKLNDRLVSITQSLASAIVHRLTLRQALTSQQQIVDEVSAALRTSEAVAMLGIEILSVVILAVKPTPETAKALEAEAREQLLRQSDEAIYARRNGAVEQERRIKESELNTELAVQEKQRQIREKQMQADIATEQQRATLIGTQVENEQKLADAKAYALETSLKPLRETDWRVLMAANSANMDPRVSTALAFREIAENAGKIGELNITSDLFAALTKPAGK